MVEVKEAESLQDVFSLVQRMVELAQHAGRAQVVSTTYDESSNRRVVLLVQDDVKTAELISFLLRQEGFEVVHYLRGTEALAAAKTLYPAAVVIDAGIDDDGFKLLKKLRHHPRYSTVPIVMMTNVGNELAVVRGFEQGADDYVMKPVAPLEFMARIHRLLRRAQQT
jgi:DNA-binding response OmpR family regulator